MPPKFSTIFQHICAVSVVNVDVKYGIFCPLETFCGIQKVPKRRLQPKRPPDRAGSLRHSQTL